ncbi:MAG: valine--tRNA ligase [Deltaproteobacteria bacterium]|nr:MAG: valine--tRNA ligase [Deltaproteobacteria bacterium]
MRISAMRRPRRPASTSSSTRRRRTTHCVRPATRRGRLSASAVAAPLGAVSFPGWERRRNRIHRASFAKGRTMSAEELPSAYDPAAAAEKWSVAWAKAGVFVADPEAEGEPYSIVIPPPNVTGSLHMGHALNNTLQDVLIRYKRMDGFNALWVPGVDHAGIATQWVVRRQIEAEGLDFREYGREKFLERTWNWKGESQANITNQLKRLGVSCDWSRERFTLDDGLARAVKEHFCKLYEDGLIYRGERLINWDCADQTALSDLEVEHDENVKGELWSFAYELSEGEGEIVVATTRPETMLGDTAVAVHPDDERYKHLIGKTVKHPFVDREIPIVADAILVDPEFGTGCVKITPAHDFNDFEVGKRHDLPMINILNRDGTINGQGGQFEGMDVPTARKAVKAAIEELGLFRGSKEHLMNIGRSQRSKAIVEPMLSTQWFVSMKPLATPALAAVELGATEFVPKQWENTYYAWLRDIRDWCISRQLWWGHRIPAYYCDDCGKVMVLRDEPEACTGCGSTNWHQDEDVLDTWFSSALWPFSTMGWPDKTADLAKYYPTSVLVTGFDIIFFWVARMMFAGLYFTGQVPFKDVYIHALVRDQNGEKMSKTKGNVVDPLTVIDSAGADAFRFTLIAFAAQGRDVLWDPKRVEGYQRFTTKIWQALRYCFLDGEAYDPNAPMEFGPYEHWIRARTGAAVARVRTALDGYKFNEAAAEIYQFVWGEYCDWYLELSKTTRYSDTLSEARKNGTRHVLFETMGVIVRLLHPMMPFLTEEIWSKLPGTPDGFVTTAPYPKEADFPRDQAVLDEIALLQQTITEIRRIRGEMELSPRVGLRLLVGDDALLAKLQAHTQALDDLAGVQVEALTERPAGVATAVVRGVECVIPLEGVVDFAEELKRLDKVLAKSEKDVSQLERRLSNPKFVEKAPEDVVAEVKEKLELAKSRHETLVASRARIAEAIQ